MLDSLNILLKASSKSILETCLNMVFISRFDSSQVCSAKLCDLLEISPEESKQLYDALLECIRAALSSGQVKEVVDLLELEGKNVNPKLKGLLIQTIGNALESWKEAAAMGRVSFPKLVNMDWSMRIKKSSSEVRNMAVPTVMIQLQVEECPNNVNNMSNPVNIHHFECDANTLDLMFEGLVKIRDQLGNVAR